MDNILYHFERPSNEEVKQYAAGSPERVELRKAIAQLKAQEVDVPLIIGGKEVRTGNTGSLEMPHRHSEKLGTYHKAGEKEIQMAIDAALKAHQEWSRMPWLERTSIMLKIAELFSTKYRYLLNASVMLGQSKNPMQAEIDAPCELIDFLTFGAYYASKIYEEQPLSVKGIYNRLEYRPLEGFVFALTPFNFTSIASNLNLAPAMMGNVTVWKPSSTAIYSNYLLMKVFKEAGLPDGVVNFIPGEGKTIGKYLLAHEQFAALHFTGSSATFNNIWSSIAENLGRYRSYPKIVGETGGKNYVLVHPSANTEEVAVALLRGAFEYQGQKCSAASRAYIPRSLWKDLKLRLLDEVATIKVGDVENFSNFMNAVIDEASFDNIKSYIDFAKRSSKAKILCGGACDKFEGYFVQPTIIETSDPFFKTMQEEIFGPVLTVYVYEDAQWGDDLFEMVDKSSVYALTGSVFARDRKAVLEAMDSLRFSAGNFYVNDKPTGAVVGQQPFGGSRMSGTNDKAGGPLNLLRWVNPRNIKETFNPPIDYRYPFLEED